ncbi:hypothetical protein MTBSS4_460020 [Magnetospirillum sp. SS-4]|nr:hypothetical protein MTBSS4_460020 [Magnetospirillum sp. SS-4]
MKPNWTRCPMGYPGSILRAQLAQDGWPLVLRDLPRSQKLLHLGSGAKRHCSLSALAYVCARPGPDMSGTLLVGNLKGLRGKPELCPSQLIQAAESVALTIDQNDA